MVRYPELRDKEWLIEQYVNQDRTQSDIADELGCAQTTVGDAIRKHDIDTSRIKYPELDNPEWLEQKHHRENLGLGEISDELGCTRSAVGYAMRRNDLEIRRNTLVHELDSPLSSKAKQIIEGELLGDGCIPKPRGKAGAMFSYGTSREQYRDWLANWFENQGYGVTKHDYLQDDDREGWSETHTYRFNTHIYFSLMDFRKEWYPNGEKIVPESFELTPLSLRHMYIGDGSFPESREEIAIYTDGFELEYVERLQSQLESVGIESIITHRNSIQINREDSRERFFEYMAPLPKELSDVYGYKWP